MNRTRQNNQQVLALEPKDRGEAPARGDGETEPFMAKSATENSAFTEQLMEEVCDRENLERAWKRVKRNKGSPGADGMTIDDAKAFLRQHWPNIRSQLLDGNYRPQPVKRVEIPKPDGGVRKLGVPCVVDRLIQQAVLQVLQERWDPTFSEHSFGFRPGRSAHQAVAQAQRYVADGYNVVVDLDLERFFDRVNHDILMSRVAAREKPIEANKNQAVDGTEGLFLGSGSPQNVYLLPQHPNFHLERCPRPKQICDHPNNEPDKISHPVTASPDSRSTASQIEFATGTRGAIRCPKEKQLTKKASGG